MLSFAWVSLCALCISIPGNSQFLDPNCRYSFSPKIIDGTDAGQKSSKYMAAIKRSGEFICGGTLITKRFVLSAAHCMESSTDLSVMLGAHNKSNPELEIPVIQTIKHQHFNRNDLSNDIGLLKLSHDVVIGNLIQPVCIYVDKNSMWRAEQPTFKALGWGKTRHANDSEILQSVMLSRKDLSHCQNLVNVDIYLTQICAEGQGFGDSCTGDSGGPLIVSVDKLETQIGIVSYGLSQCTGLALYTDVTKFVDWIAESIRLNEVALSGRIPIFSQPEVQPSIWLHRDCGGDTMLSNMRALIFGIDFRANGAFITEQFVLANSNDLQSHPLRVRVIGYYKSFGEYGVHSVMRHSKDSTKNDIAVLRLNKPVTLTDGLKPFCMLGHNYYQHNVYLNPPLTIFGQRNDRNEVYSCFIFAVEILELRKCANDLYRTIYTNELCVKDPNATTHYSGKPGDLVFAKITHLGQEHLVLFGIVSFAKYTGEGHVFKNIRNQIEWITNVINYYYY